MNQQEQKYLLQCRAALETHLLQGAKETAANEFGAPNPYVVVGFLILWPDDYIQTIDNGISGDFFNLARESPVVDDDAENAPQQPSSGPTGRQSLPPPPPPQAAGAPPPPPPPGASNASVNGTNNPSASAATVTSPSTISPEEDEKQTQLCVSVLVRRLAALADACATYERAAETWVYVQATVSEVRGYQDPPPFRDPRRIQPTSEEGAPSCCLFPTLVWRRIAEFLPVTDLMNLPLVNCSALAADRDELCWGTLTERTFILPSVPLRKAASEPSSPMSPHNPDPDTQEGENENENQTQELFGWYGEFLRNARLVAEKSSRGPPQMPRFVHHVIPYGSLRFPKGRDQANGESFLMIDHHPVVVCIQARRATGQKYRLETLRVNLPGGGDSLLKKPISVTTVVKKNAATGGTLRGVMMKTQWAQNLIKKALREGSLSAGRDDLQFS